MLSSEKRFKIEQNSKNAYLSLLSPLSANTSARAAVRGRHCGIIVLATAGFVLVSVAGCAPSFQGEPNRLYSVQHEVQFAQGLSSQWYGQYVKIIDSGGDPGALRALRDRIIYARMYGIDQNYSEYEAALTRERQNTGFWSNIAVLGLTTAGTVVGGAQTKAILHAIAAGLTGVGTAYNEKILIEKTIDILQKSMRAHRNDVRATIIQRLQKADVMVYPLELALADLEDYYRAGTLTGAFIGVSNDVSKSLEASIAKENKIIELNLKSDAASTNIYDWLNKNPSRNSAELMNWLKQLPGNVTIDDFLGLPEYASSRQEFANQKIKP